MDDGSVTDSLLSAEIVGCLSLGWATLSVVASQTTRFNVSLFVPDQWNVAVDSILKAHSRRFLQDPFLRSLNSSPRLILLSSLSLCLSLDFRSGSSLLTDGALDVITTTTKRRREEEIGLILRQNKETERESGSDFDPLFL